MRFLADQDVYHMTLAFLKSQRHDILAAQELGMQRASDEELLPSPSPPAGKVRMSPRDLFEPDTPAFGFSGSSRLSRVCGV
ncbi:MAG: DUF5615 family PIN-like protein [Nitrospirales bacterium]